MTWYPPKLLNYAGPYVTAYWAGTNLCNIYPNHITSPTFSRQVVITNQPTIFTGQPHGLVIFDGNENGGLCIGGDLDQGSALTGGNAVDKAASIKAPSVYSGLFDTTLIGWAESAGNGGYGGVLGIGGNGNFTELQRNAPIYIDFFTKPFSLPPDAGMLRWRIDNEGTLSSQNGSAFDLGTGGLKVGGSVGITANIKVLTAGGQTNQLRFKDGILIGIVPQ
jgi:hypothetical protein